ncbi:hypothetical protein ColLi_03403 [Colletotrichum liriopes]|uniref:Uncharacterized protein n=1 Tax=Colletotrichum liriopes TaxID=708192 RepID=A0AA37GH77_9PEZI|nr:hypothetical protein ColLi_03403 [Colletotrichum liriopes]
MASIAEMEAEAPHNNFDVHDLWLWWIAASHHCHDITTSPCPEAAQEAAQNTATNLLPKRK